MAGMLLAAYKGYVCDIYGVQAKDYVFSRFFTIEVLLVQTVTVLITDRVAHENIITQTAICAHYAST